MCQLISPVWKCGSVKAVNPRIQVHFAIKCMFREQLKYGRSCG